MWQQLFATESCTPGNRSAGRATALATYVVQQGKLLVVLAK
jgi:hypothetical protein